MRGFSLKTILSRVDRLAIDGQHDDKNWDEVVRTLQAGRLRAARGEFRALTAEEAIARGRALRQALREQGIKC